MRNHANPRPHPPRIPGWALLASLVLIAPALGCGGSQDRSDESTAQNDTTPGTTAGTGTALNDAQIAAIVVTANSIDIRNGELALSKTQNGEVREFARHMITDHTSMNGKANDLATRLQMTPEPSDASRQLESDAARTMEDLKAKTGEDFERAYAAGEVALHQKVISMVDDTLIPQARNEELKAQLVAARPILVMHLEHAQQVDSTLRADGAR